MLTSYNCLYKIAINRLNMNGEIADKSSRRLASGLKINSAADDSSGLAISEKMRSMIIGLNRATQNVQDAISLIQTADGGLSNVVEQLQRIRELCIEAANGTLTDYDRSLIQKEIDEIKGGIDSTANNTEFNAQKVLRPPVETKPGTKSGKADIIFVIDRTGSMGSKIQNVKDNLDGFVKKMTDNGIDVNLGLITYGDINSTKNPTDKDIIKYEMTSTSADFLTKLNQITLGHGDDYAESGLEGIMDPTNGALSYTLRDGSTKQIIFVTDATVHTASGDKLSAYDISEVSTALKDAGFKFTLVADNNTTVKNQFEPIISNTNGKFLDINSSFKDSLEKYAGEIVSDSGTTTEATDMKDFIIQVGANKDQTITLEMMDTRIMQIGLKDLSVTTADNAEVAISTVDNIMDKVATQRSRLGAYQNRLEFIFSTNENASENLSTANSRIKDADIAKEMTTVAKANILQNATQAVLAQSIQLHKGMLMDLFL